MTTPRNSMPTPQRADAVSSRRVRDPYADLLRDTRGLRREQAAARDAWLAGIAIERKEECLFELEMLLKGIAAWGNARNHPSPTSATPLYARNFRPHLQVARAAVGRCLTLAGMLLGGGRRATSVTRQLPSVFLDEARAERTDAPTSETPEQSLQALAQSLRASGVVFDGLAGVAFVPYRLFYAATATLQRDVARNPFFNPLFTLEFRPEFDRVRVPDVLDAIVSVDGEAAHRLVTLSFLGALRLLRMCGLLQSTVAEPDGVSRAWVLFAALRAEARALCHVLQRRAPALLAESVERDLMRIPAAEMRARYDTSSHECERLGRVRAVMLAAAATLRAETRRAMRVAVPACDGPATSTDAAAAMQVACVRMRDAVQGIVVQLTWALRNGADAERIFNDRNARRAAGERLRQAAWMFSLVTRAFVREARAVNTDDVWSVAPSLAFARDYFGYYRAIGHPIALESDYPEIERLASALSPLRDADWIDAPRLATAIAEAEAFRAHLTATIERVSARDDMRASPFDKPLAAETLRMYLGT